MTFFRFVLYLIFGTALMHIFLIVATFIIIYTGESPIQTGDVFTHSYMFYLLPYSFFATLGVGILILFIGKGK